MANNGNLSVPLPKPIMIGAAMLILLGLFLASGDPGKKEREQLRQALTEAQGKINLLENARTEQQAQLKSQQEATQLLLRRLEVSEENNSRLRARIDETERQLVAQRKAVANAAKSQAKPTTATKPTTGTKTTTPTKKQ